MLCGFPLKLIEFAIFLIFRKKNSAVDLFTSLLLCCLLISHHYAGASSTTTTTRETYYHHQPVNNYSKILFQLFSIRRYVHFLFEMNQINKRLLLVLFIVYGCVILSIHTRSQSLFFISSNDDDVSFNLDDIVEESISSRDGIGTGQKVKPLIDNKQLDLYLSKEENDPDINTDPTKQIDDDDFGKESSSILEQLTELTLNSAIVNTASCPKPLSLYQNRVFKDVSLSKQPIPLILHVSMKSRCLPQDLIFFMKRWEEKIPQFSIFFHDDDAVERLFEQSWPEFPLLKTFMQCVQYKGAMKIDVWRLLVLYKYGGIYTDIDNWPPESFKQQWFIDPSISAFFFSDTNGRPSQWFMATEPQHPILYNAIMQALSNIAAMVNIGRPSVVQVTGPEALKSGFSIFFPEEERNKVLNYDGGNFTGWFSKKVRKMSLQETRENIKVAYGYEDIVPFNSTLNVTRRERIEMESGVVHWDNHIHRSFKKGYGFRGSCIKYLAHLDKEGKTIQPHYHNDTNGSPDSLKRLFYVERKDSNINCGDSTAKQFVNKMKLKSTKSNIPMVLHVYVATDSQCLTQDQSSLIERWQKALPNVSIFIHDDQALKNLLQEEWHEFPYLRNIAQCVQGKNSMVIDLWKFLVLYKYGGIFTSLEILPSDSFKEAWFTDQTISSLFFTSANGNQTSSTMIGIEPRHSIMYFTILKILDNYMRLPDIHNLDKEETIGAKSLMYGYKKNFHHEMDEFNKLFLSKETRYTGLFSKKVRKLSLDISTKAFDQNLLEKPFTPKIRRVLSEENSRQSCRQYLQTMSFGQNG